MSKEKAAVRQVDKVLTMWSKKQQGERRALPAKKIFYAGILCRSWPLFSRWHYFCL